MYLDAAIFREKLALFAVDEQLKEESAK